MDGRGACLLTFQAVEEKTKGDEDEDDEDCEDRLEDEGEDVGEASESLTGILDLVDHPLRRSFDGTGAEERERGDICNAVARGGGDFFCSKFRSRSCVGRKFDECRG